MLGKIQPTQVSLLSPQGYLNDSMADSQYAQNFLDSSVPPCPFGFICAVMSSRSEPKRPQGIRKDPFFCTVTSGEKAANNSV